jgi:hypothetical protein
MMQRQVDKAFRRELKKDDIPSAAYLLAVSFEDGIVNSRNIG